MWRSVSMVLVAWKVLDKRRLRGYKVCLVEIFKGLHGIFGVVSVLIGLFGFVVGFHVFFFFF